MNTFVSVQKFAVRLLLVMAFIAGFLPQVSLAQEASGRAAPSPLYLPVVSQARTPVGGESWRGEYFANRTLAGPPVLVRNDAAIKFAWGSAAPAPTVPAAAFSTRWTRTVHLLGGTYRFNARVDGGVRVWLDGRLILDEWHAASGQTYWTDQTLAEGDYALRVEYEKTSETAAVEFWWAQIGEAPTWRGEYFANMILSGQPNLTRSDPSLDFNWGGGAPDLGLPADGFSARWTRSVALDGGTYRFHALVDDGVRVFVDGRIVIDQWRDGALREVTGDVALAQGVHGLRVEYYENSGAARIAVWWEKISPPVSYPDWKGEYFNNTGLSGSPVLVRNDAQIKFDWGSGAPASSLPTDRFSARWTRSASFDAATYRFHVRMDDGVRLWVDGNLLIDDWREASTREIVKDYALGSGVHSLRVEYFEATGEARIEVWWEKLSPPVSFPDWKGEYFDNTGLSGNPVLVRNDRSIDFNWGSGAPASNLPADRFSARWTRSASFDGGTYRFHLTVDDGVRLWVDGQLVADDWREGSVREITRDVSLAAGSHSLRVEFLELTGQARIHVWWEKVQAPTTCVEVMQNGGFETDAAWIMRSNPVLAGYVTWPVYSGHRSLRTGIPAGGANLLSYSPAEQSLVIPSSATSTKLSYWRYNVWGDAGLAKTAELPRIEAMPKTEAELGRSSFGIDFFYVILIRNDGSLDWLQVERLDNPGWRHVEIDLSRYAGQEVRLQFGTYNNGSGGISRTFVDNAALRACP